MSDPVGARSRPSRVAPLGLALLAAPAPAGPPAPQPGEREPGARSLRQVEADFGEKRLKTEASTARCLRAFLGASFSEGL